MAGGKGARSKATGRGKAGGSGRNSGGEARGTGGATQGARSEQSALQHGREVLGLGLIALAVFLFLSGLSYSWPDAARPETTGAASNWGGAVGHALAGTFLDQLGLPSFVLFAFVLYWGMLLIVKRPPRQPLQRIFGAFALTLVLAIFLSGPEMTGSSARTPFGHGGSIGHWLAPRLYTSFGGAGSVLLLLLTGAIAFFVATDWTFREFVSDLRGAWNRSRELRAQRAAKAAGSAGAAKSGRGEDAGEAAPSLRLRIAPLLQAFRRSAGAMRNGVVQLFRKSRGEDAVPALAEGPVIERPARDSQPVPIPRREDPPAQRSPEAAEPERQDGSAVAVTVEAASEEPAETHGEAAQDAPAARKRPTPRKPARAPRIHRETPRKRVPQAPLPGGEGYEYPPLDLLAPPEFADDVASEETLRRRAEAIERRLASHKVDARVVSISAGPAVTVFELEVGEGQRIASLTRFAPDLAAALKALSVRVVAPIPGKHTVGVEVPNEKRSFVRLRELIEAEDCSKRTIPLCLGRDVAGKVLVEDLARMPHLLIAGATGSGKSVCINSILLSIMMLRSPAECRLILIDPKMVELQNYASIPHLMCPVVTNMKKAPTVLAWAVETMEKRYALLSACGVRKLDDYNDLGEAKLKQKLGLRYDPEETPPHLPSIVVVIDEFADLMTVAAAEVEVSIQRLAQKSRAVGIHVILATQRPSRDVITGLIKANLPTRIAFQVSNRIDSRVILDANGADQLLGHGDMLYIPPGTNRLVRAQGSFVSDDEIHDVVEFLENKVGRQVFEQELMQSPTGSNRSARDRDELFDKAVRIVLEEQRGSATLLQRKLSVGYTRASRLIELMEEEGVVGLHKGSKSREVMLSLEDWEAMHGPAEPEKQQGDLFAEENVYAPSVHDIESAEDAAYDVDEADYDPEAELSGAAGLEEDALAEAEPESEESSELAPWEDLAGEPERGAGDELEPVAAEESPDALENEEEAEEPEEPEEPDTEEDAEELDDAEDVDEHAESEGDAGDGEEEEYEEEADEADESDEEAEADEDGEEWEWVYEEDSEEEDSEEDEDWAEGDEEAEGEETEEDEGLEEEDEDEDAPRP
jgi:S-DNA-T family DNA segregation ATPase FtsK/SpoIIIE